MTNGNYLKRERVRRETFTHWCGEVLRPYAVITLELGCGHGHFLTAYARAHPAKCCVGIDLKEKRILRCFRKKQRAYLPHLYFLKAEAREFIDSLQVHSIQLDRIFVLFPDPWPKRRHGERRLMQASLLDALAQLALEGAMLCFRTDVFPHYEWSRQLVERSAHWMFQDEVSWPFEEKTFFQERSLQYHSFVAVLKKIHPESKE